MKDTQEGSSSLLPGETRIFLQAKGRQRLNIKGWGFKVAGERTRKPECQDVESGVQAQERETLQMNRAGFKLILWKILHLE